MRFIGKRAMWQKRYLIIIVVGLAVFLMVMAQWPILRAQEADPSIGKIQIAPLVHSLNPCEKKKFKANIKNKSGKRLREAKVTWKSTNPTVARVDKNGVVTGVNPGFTFIRAVNGTVKSNATPVFVRDKGVRRC